MPLYRGLACAAGVGCLAGRCAGVLCGRGVCADSERTEDKRVVMTADTSTAANASATLAAGRRILQIQFRRCCAFFIIASSRKLICTRDSSIHLVPDNAKTHEQMAHA